MRPKFVFALLLLAALALVAAFFLRPHPENEKTPAGSESATPPPILASNVVTSVSAPPEPTPEMVSNPAAPAVASVPTDEQRQTAIDAETDRLQQWSMNDDTASLSNILADLTNSEKEIRGAAIEAAKQFGSTNAIPALKAAAEGTGDVQEKIAYLEAADFLSLPSMDLSGPNANSSTPEQTPTAQPTANAQKHGPNQNSPAASDPNSPPVPEN